jgi:hypothetical protein
MLSNKIRHAKFATLEAQMNSNTFFLIVISCILGGCAEKQFRAEAGETKQALPKGASNIKNVGNNWITFQWNDGAKEKCFLYHKEIEGINEFRVGFESIAPIDCK